MYKNVAIVPIKTKSERYENKNFRPLKGKPLYQLLLDKITGCEFDAIFVDTDSLEIKQYSKDKGYHIINRKPELAEKTANGNDLLVHQSSLISAEIYFQLFVTAPLITVDTINKAIDIMNSESAYDSLFTAQQIYSWFWFDGCPVNYDPSVLPPSQNAQPIIRETTGLYAIRKSTLERKRCRIGDNPYMLFVNAIEAVDLDNALDFKIAEALMDSI